MVNGSGWLRAWVPAKQCLLRRPYGPTTRSFFARLIRVNLNQKFNVVQVDGGMILPGLAFPLEAAASACLQNLSKGQEKLKFFYLHVGS